MQNGNLPLLKNIQNRNGRKKAKKRKFTSVEDGAAATLSKPPKIFKPALSSEDFIPSKKKVSKFLHYKSTNEYTQVVANPKLLPRVPKIFQTDCSNNIIPNGGSNSFLYNLLTLKSFNTDISERFCQKHKSEKVKRKEKPVKKKEEKSSEDKPIEKKESLEEKPIKKKKSPKEKLIEKEKEEKSPEEKVGNDIINKEKQKSKKLKKKEQKESLKAQRGNGAEDNGSLSEEEENISQVDVYEAVQEKTSVFHMHHPSTFSFQGEIKITAIAGEVEILGYTLSENSAEAYSPEFCSSLTVETKPPKQRQSREEMEKKIKNVLTEKDYESVFQNLKSNDSIILVEQIMSRVGIVINKYFDVPLFPKDLEDVSSTTKTLKTLQSTISFRLLKKGKHFRKSPHWDKIPLGQCTVLCGGKGVGKSTLLKYYVNKLVTLGEKVLCLDFDPGQSEFTFPGCVSAVVVDEPLLGPNFTHVKDPVVMMCFGDIDVSQNPSKYLECVKHIVETCRKNDELLKMKWFVNTMGFCKGLGVHLMITILKLLKPNTVVQLKASESKNNYPFYLTPVTLNSKRGFRSMPVDNVSLSYDLRVIYSCAEYKRKQLQGGLKQRQLRDIMAISYFSKMVSPPYYNFNAVQPYLISFSKVYLGIDFLVSPEDVLKAFNGNTVYLSHVEPDDESVLSVEPEGHDYFKVIVKPKVSPVLGIGFVRGIDCRGKKFYIMTHLPMEILESVNCLSLGKVSPPHSMFLRQETVEGETVYTTLGTIDTIQRVKRMFRALGTPQNKEKTCA